MDVASAGADGGSIAATRGIASGLGAGVSCVRGRQCALSLAEPDVVTVGTTMAGLNGAVRRERVSGAGAIRARRGYRPLTVGWRLLSEGAGGSGNR